MTAFGFDSSAVELPVVDGSIWEVSTRWLQRALNATGYVSVVEDGRWGPATREALSDFMSWELPTGDRPPDGRGSRVVVGTKTYRALATQQVRVAQAVPPASPTTVEPITLPDDSAALSARSSGMGAGWLVGGALVLTTALVAAGAWAVQTQRRGRRRR